MGSPVALPPLTVRPTSPTGTVDRAPAPPLTVRDGRPGIFAQLSPRALSSVEDAGKTRRPDCGVPGSCIGPRCAQAAGSSVLRRSARSLNDSSARSADLRSTSAFFSPASSLVLRSVRAPVRSGSMFPSPETAPGSHFLRSSRLAGRLPASVSSCLRRASGSTPAIASLMASTRLAISSGEGKPPVPSSGRGGTPSRTERERPGAPRAASRTVRFLPAAGGVGPPTVRKPR